MTKEELRALQDAATKLIPPPPTTDPNGIEWEAEWVPGQEVNISHGSMWSTEKPEYKWVPGHWRPHTGNYTTATPNGPMTEEEMQELKNNPMYLGNWQVAGRVRMGAHGWEPRDVNNRKGS